MKGRNGSTSFLPLNKKGGLITNVFSKKCLTEEQTKYVYDKVESGDELKVRKVSPDIKEEGQRMDIDFGESPNVLKDKYMEVQEDVFAEVVMTNRFDENVDLSTTYLGKIGMKREDIMKAEESFPISEQGFVKGRILNG